MAESRRPGKALVTGGAGFIGSHLCGALLDQGFEVYALDDLSTGSIANVAPLRERPDFHLVVDSVLSPAVVNELVYKCDVVYHLAAAVGDPRDDAPFVEDARRVYGPTTQRRWAYADSKAMDEFLALAYHQERGLDCVIVRLFNTVGPRQSGEYGMVVPRFVSAALAGRPLEIHGDGSQTRCFCHVSDTIRALAGLAEAPSTNGEIYNVGSTESIGILDLAHRVLELTGSSSELGFVPYDQVYGQGIEDMLNRKPSIEKIRQAIGWRPALDLDRILADVVDWARTAPTPVELADA